jgi:hypothetical protein
LHHVEVGRLGKGRDQSITGPKEKEKKKSTRIKKPFVKNQRIKQWDDPDRKCP